MSPDRTTIMDGFEQIRVRKKGLKRIRCTLCASALVMDHSGMITHAEEPEHQSRLKERNEVGWGDWEAPATAWGTIVQDWGGGHGGSEELARWMPSEEEVERERAEQDKKIRILRWIEGVEAARQDLI